MTFSQTDGLDSELLSSHAEMSIDAEIANKQKKVLRLQKDEVVWLTEHLFCLKLVVVPNLCIVLLHSFTTKRFAGNHECMLPFLTRQM